MSYQENTIYQQLILRHNKCPCNYGKLEDSQFYSEGVNRLCGDRYQVYLNLDDSQRVQAVKFEGEGCALSKASASIMTEMILGKSLEEVNLLCDGFERFVTDSSVVETLEKNEVDDWRAFYEMKNFPARKKCATIIWQTLNAAISKQKNLVVD